MRPREEVARLFARQVLGPRDDEGERAHNGAGLGVIEIGEGLPEMLLA